MHGCWNLLNGQLFVLHRERYIAKFGKRRNALEARFMNKVVNTDGRLAWSKPEIRRIDAGSAETKASGTKSDGGSGGSNKS